MMKRFLSLISLTGLVGILILTGPRPLPAAPEVESTPMTTNPGDPPSFAGDAAELEREEKARLKIDDDFDALRKDPLLAGVLSWYMPGLGQVYGGRPLKGAGYFLMETSFFLTSFLAIADLELSADADSGINIGAKVKRNELGEIPNSNKQLAVGFLLLGAGFHVWNIVDAVNTTKEFNERAYRRLEIKYSARQASLSRPGLPGYRLTQNKEDRHYVSVSHKF